jgi:hypothetical protein
MHLPPGIAERDARKHEELVGEIVKVGVSMGEGAGDRRGIKFVTVFIFEPLYQL